MQKINDEPNFGVNEVLCEALHYMQKNTTNKGAVILQVHNDNNLLPIFCEYEEEYVQYGDKLHYLSSSAELDDVNGIDKDVMKGLYKKFYDKNSKFRRELYKLTPRSCPICDAEWGYASHTLDHILPESKYPQFAVTPLNLVPTCYRCNHSKSTTVGTQENQGVINPYFNYINLSKYLSCKIYVKSSDLVTNIFLKSESELDITHLQYQKLKFFYEEVYKLNESYSEIARISVLNSMIDTLAKFNQTFSKSDMIVYFKSIADTQELSENERISTEFLKSLLLHSLLEMEDQVYMVLINLINEKRTQAKEFKENF